MRDKYMLLTLVVAFTLCIGTSSAEEGENSKPIKNNTQKIDSLRYKIGQMLVCGFKGVKPDEHTMMMVSRHFIGGVILFDKDVSNKFSTRNIINPAQLKSLVHELKQMSTSKLLVAIDQEGGRIARLKPEKGFNKSVSAQFLGAKNNADTTRYYAEMQAQELKDLGINLNLTPCVDLNVNPKNPIIGKLERAYSRNPYDVAKHAQIVVEEHNKKGVATSLKHFPGHGSSTVDSHKGITNITNTFQLDELIPYRELINGGYNDIVMMGHLINNNIDSLPASLSQKSVKLLRENYNFKGVIATDDLNMGAISDQFPYHNALKLAVNAGVDMIIIGNNGREYVPALIETTIAHIYEMVKNGQIDETRINEAYNKIKSLKQSIN